MYKGPGPYGGPLNTPTLSLALCVSVCVWLGRGVSLTRKLTSSNFKLNTSGSYHDDRALQALSYLPRRDEERGRGGRKESRSEGGKEGEERQRERESGVDREKDTGGGWGGKEGGREDSQAESESCCCCISVFFMSRQFTGRLFTVWYLALLGHCSQCRLPSHHPLPHWSFFKYIYLLVSHFLHLCVHSTFSKCTFCTFSPSLNGRNNSGWVVRGSGRKSPVGFHWIALGSWSTPRAWGEKKSD